MAHIWVATGESNPPERRATARPDEPTGNLDSKSGNQILRILQNLNDEGRTIVMVTHEQETAYYSKRMLHLRDGHFELDEVVKNRLIAKDIEFKK